jgi:hypothetical protein
MDLLIAAPGRMAFVSTAISGVIGHHLPDRLIFGINLPSGGALRFWFLLLPNLPGSPWPG